MDDKEKARKHRMRKYAIKFQAVNPLDLLPRLHCLPVARKQRIKCEQDRQGQTIAANELGNIVVNYDDWFEQLIPALRELGHSRLADLLEDPTTDTGRQHAPLADRQNDQRNGSDIRSEEKGPATHPSPEQPKNLTRCAPADSSSSSREVRVEVTRATHYRQLPCSVVQVLRRLDVRSPTARSDWMGLAGELGFSVDSVHRLQALHESPTEALLKEWGNESDATLGKLLESLQAIDRLDIYQQLEETLGLLPQAPNRPQIKGSPGTKSKVDDPGVNDGPVASDGDQSWKTSFGNPTPHQHKTTPFPDDVIQSKPGGKSATSSNTSPRVEGGSNEAKIAAETSVGELPATSHEQPADGASSQMAADSANEPGADGGSTIADEPAQKDCLQEKNSEDKLAHGKGSESQDTAMNREPSADLRCTPSSGSGPGIKNIRHMPVNDLNRARQVDNQDTRPAEFDPNCTGKTLLSGNQQLQNSSSSNSSDYFRGNCYNSPEDVIGPLRSDQSMDDIPTLQFSDSSCATNVSEMNSGAEPESDVTATMKPQATRLQPATPPTKPAAATASPFPPQSARPSAAASSAATSATRSHILSTQRSSQGGPIQQPQESSKFFPDIHAIPTVDGTYTKDDLIVAANPTQFDEQSPQASVEAKLVPGSIIQTYQQPPAASSQVLHRQPPVSATPSIPGHPGNNSKKPEIEKKDKNKADNQEQNTSTSGVNIQKFAGAKDVPEQTTDPHTVNIQQDRPSPQMVKDAEDFPTIHSSSDKSQTITLHPKRDAPHDPRSTQSSSGAADDDHSSSDKSQTINLHPKKDAPHDPPRSTQSSSGAADDDQIGTQSSLPLEQTEEDQQDPHQSDDDQDEAATGAAAEPQGLRASVSSSLAIAVPVVLTIASAVTSGGDFISNLFQ